MQTLKVHYEYFKGQFIKWIISGELPIGLDSKFWSNRQIIDLGFGDWELKDQDLHCIAIHKSHLQIAEV